MRTELRIDGANCPTCFNETLNALRSRPGVDRMAASSTSGCLVIDHNGLDPAALVDTVRSHLHGVAKSGDEIVMVSVEPLVVELHCDHGTTLLDNDTVTQQSSG